MLQRIYEPLTSGSYYAQPGALPGCAALTHPAQLIVTSTQSAEIIKHASNAFLAMKISFINAVANLAEAVDADIEDISLRARSRQPDRSQVSARRAGLWRLLFPEGRGRVPLGGAGTGRRFSTAEEVRKINETQKEVFFNKVRSALWTLRGKRLAALGLAFKGDTDDIRESPAINMIQMLLQAGAMVTAFDPAAMERAKEVLPPAKNMRYASDLYEAAKDADAVLILTDWKEFADDGPGAAEPGHALPDRD